MAKSSNIAFKALAPLAGAVIFGIGIWVGAKFFSSNTGSAPLGKIEMLMNLIGRNYVDRIDTDSLLEATIPDLMAKLDPHSSYIPASELEDVNSDLEGAFSGVGISFTISNDTIVVLEVVNGGPSERVGLLAGDRIITIDDSVAAGKNWSNSKVMSTLRGPKDTVVKLGIKRDTSPELLDYEITRGEVPTTSVDASYIIEPGVGYIKVSKFARTTYNEFIEALGSLHFQGADKYIIDLRGNGGGFMEMAVLMANEFLPPLRTIVSTRSKDREHESLMLSDDNGSFHDAEVVVLIDEFSASASEIFAGAIQDNDRGVVIGRRSFGKGLVQQQYELPDSSAVRLTVSRYYTPAGRSIQKPFVRGASKDYDKDLLDRFSHGEAYSADSIRLDTTVTYLTVAGRPVYGGGGIMPDIFVPNDTADITSYFIAVQDAGAFHKFALDYVDKNRNRLSEANDTEELLVMLPEDRELLRDFAMFASRECGIEPNWRNINISRYIIVNNLKALIARDVLGIQALYEIINLQDATVSKAVEIITTGTDSVLNPVTE